MMMVMIKMTMLLMVMMTMMMTVEAVFSDWWLQ